MKKGYLNIFVCVICMILLIIQNSVAFGQKRITKLSDSDKIQIAEVIMLKWDLSSFGNKAFLSSENLPNQVKELFTKINGVELEIIESRETAKTDYAGEYYEFWRFELKRKKVFVNFTNYEAHLSNGVSYECQKTRKNWRCKKYSQTLTQD